MAFYLVHLQQTMCQALGYMVEKQVNTTELHDIEAYGLTENTDKLGNCNLIQQVLERGGIWKNFSLSILVYTS